ncbi:hypothetical protein, partial [Mycobacterium tuberculosis]
VIISRVSSTGAPPPQKKVGNSG